MDPPKRKQRPSHLPFFLPSSNVAATSKTLSLSTEAVFTNCSMRHTVQKASDWPLLADSVAWHAGQRGAGGSIA